MNKSQKQKLIEALRPFAQLAVDKCSKCEGTGKQFNSTNACFTCGGFGEVVMGFISPDDVRDAAKAMVGLI